MSNRILSTVVYSAATNSYANLTPANSPLSLNETGDLIFNTNNLALYNQNSNNRILRPTGANNFFFNTVLDNIFIGGNNSTIYGACHSIINSDNSIISGEYYNRDQTWILRNNNISNSLNSCIMEASFSTILNSYSSMISGQGRQLIMNGFASCMMNNSCSSMLNTLFSISDGTYFLYNNTGGLLGGGGFGGSDTNILFGSSQRFCEAGGDMRRFTGVLGTGLGNGYSSSNSSVTTNSNTLIFGGRSNVMITSSRSLIASSFDSRISGVTNWSTIGATGGRIIANWMSNAGNVILGGESSQINNQIQNSVIIGGCCNKIESDTYPLYFSGTDSTFTYCRTTSNSAIIGGIRNCMGNNSDRSIILGGCANKIFSGFIGSVILGGCSNELGFNSTVSGCFSTINNGQGNSIQGGCFQNISAGSSNCINLGGCNTILNGRVNCISQSTGIGNLIGNGEGNRINSSPTNIGSCYNTIVNGRLNCNFSNLYSTIINGCNNKITSATSSYVFIGGGSDHCIFENASYSYILGGRSACVQNAHSGSAILADGQNRSHPSFNSDNLTLDFINGVYFAQTGVFGQINFSTRPKVNNIPILISGQTSQIFTPPTSSTSIGTSGQFVVDGDYFYFCKKDNTWIRTALSSW
jgi:hypothetical protein